MNDYLHSLCLGNYLTELPKSMLPASHAETNGAYPFYCSSSIPKSSSTWLQDKPAILMGTGGMASVHLGQELYAYSTDTWAIRISGDELDIEYAYRLLLLNLDKVDYLGFEGSGLRHLRKGFIKKLMFCVPAYEQQQKIATILTSIDTAIEKTEALIHKYQQIKAGLMHDLFIRGVTADGKLRPPREQAPELYQETPIGWVPKEWKIYTLSDLAEQSHGSTTIGPFGSDLVASDYRSEGIPIVFVRDIKETGFEWNSDVYVSIQKSNELHAHKVKPGDILSSKMGLPPCVSCEYPSWMPEGVITADIIRLRPNKKKINLVWLCEALNHDRVKRQVAGITAGVTRPKVTLADYRRLCVAVPEITEQNKVSKIISQSNNLYDSEIKNRSKLEKQKQGLMQDLLTGKVRVKVDQPKAADA